MDFRHNGSDSTVAALAELGLFWALIFLLRSWGFTRVLWYLNLWAEGAWEVLVSLPFLLPCARGSSSTVTPCWEGAYVKWRAVIYGQCRCYHSVLPSQLMA